MAFCTAAQVKGKLSIGYSTTDVPDSSATANMPLADMIARADEIIMAALRPYCYTFNAIDTATWPVPAVINLMSIHFAASMAFEQLGLIQDNMGLASPARYHVEQGNALLATVLSRRGETELETTSAEALAFGSDSGISWEIGIDEAYLALTSPLASGEPPHIIRETVRLAITSAGTSSYTAAQLNQMRFGVEYGVRWDIARRKWIFTAFNQELLKACVLVNYNWNYRRNSDDGWMGT